MINSIFGTNNENHLTMSGVDVCKIAEKYKTPLYIIYRILEKQWRV